MSSQEIHPGPLERAKIARTIYEFAAARYVDGMGVEPDEVQLGLRSGAMGARSAMLRICQETLAFGPDDALDYMTVNKLIGCGCIREDA